MLELELYRLDMSERAGAKKAEIWKTIEKIEEIRRRGPGS
jgi:hypothetical protein